MAEQNPQRVIAALDPAELRKDFPILSRRVHGKPLVYLDNTASAQKPKAVLDALDHFYRTQNSNVHRGLHELSMQATHAYEDARARIQRFIGAANSCEVIFTRGTTESINLVARSLGDRGIERGDEILITEMEHHSNIVPWQLLCERVGAVLKVVPVNDDGELMLDRLRELLSPRTKLVALAHVSNAIGTRNPIEQIIGVAHAAGAQVLIDGAQGVVHEPLDVAKLDCDFYAFSGHKIYGPTGIGVLYGKQALLERMAPFQGGGDMIHTVTFAKTTYNELPHKFEAGTPDIAGAIGLGAAIDYLSAIGMDRIAEAEQRVLQHGMTRLEAIDKVRIIGRPRDRGGLISFVVEGVHPHDAGTILDQEGVAVRAGHHCAQPLMERLAVPATVRASVGCYTTDADFDALAVGIERAIEVFS